MENILNKYKLIGKFTFKSHENLSINCNAPKNSAGVYLVYAKNNLDKTLVYIGSSGKMPQSGEIKIREGGLYDRLVNGKQFNNLPRRKCWPEKMSSEKIDELEIYWYVTFDKSIKHIPAYVEALLIQKYFEEKGLLPSWNIEL